MDERLEKLTVEIKCKNVHITIYVIEGLSRMQGSLVIKLSRTVC